ncbi:MAG TPA: alpha/beta fold hydrolase [Mycobacteriales bacterium]|nr:alpha/beta fold hydrolase [Mycobacteriales bacterium]
MCRVPTGRIVSEAILPSSSSTPKAKSRRPWLRRTLGFLLATVVAIVLGVGAIIGVAWVSASPPLFLAAGLIVFGLVLFGGIGLVTRSFRGERIRATRIGSFAGIFLVVVALFAFTTLRPAASDPQLPAAVKGLQYWDLPTGSRIAHVEIPASGTPRSTPVIVLHGGPGVPDMAGDLHYFQALAQAGFNVYLYDQVGAGRSSRLENPKHYTLERNVADLEAIRVMIGAQRIDLVGHSYGGLLAAAYMAQYGSHVGRAVMVSPADLDPGKFGASTLGRLGNDDLRKLFVNMAKPRSLLAYGLLQVNPQAAHNFAGDADMDARFDDVYRASEAAQHCDGVKLGPELHGLGYYANQYPQSASAAKHADIRPALRKLSTPTLVLKGSCDYLSWSSAEGYLSALRDSSLIYIHDAGHAIYADQPAQSMGAIRAFLSGQALPVAPYAGKSAPGDYEGPDN